MGRLTKDPEVRYTNTGKVVAQFTIAVDRPYSNSDGTRDADFFPIVIWGKSAETAGNSLSKGQRVLVEGRVQIRSYEAKDGTKRWITEVIADRFEFIERRDQWDRNRETNKSSVSGTEVNVLPETTGEGTSMGSFGAAMPDDEKIPF